MFFPALGHRRARCRFSVFSSLSSFIGTASQNFFFVLSNSMTVVPTEKDSEGKSHVVGPSLSSAAAGFSVDQTADNIVEEKGPSVVTFRQLSSRPLLFVADNFLSREECREVMDAGREQRRRETLTRPDLGKVARGAKVNIHFDPAFLDEQPVLKKVEQCVNRLLGIDCAKLSPDPWQIHVTPPPLPSRPQAGGDGEKENDNRSLLPLGLHIDLNYRWYRWVTVLLYLTDDFDGGFTLFPAADWCSGKKAERTNGNLSKSPGTSDRPRPGFTEVAFANVRALANVRAALANMRGARNVRDETPLDCALRQLTDSKCGHTGNASALSPSLREAARIVENSAAELYRRSVDDVTSGAKRCGRGDEDQAWSRPRRIGGITTGTGGTSAGGETNSTGGLAIRPQAGSCVLFFSRDSEGFPDVSSWHGGTAVVDSSYAREGPSALDAPHCKWTLQRFIEWRGGPERRSEGDPSTEEQFRTFVRKHRRLRDGRVELQREDLGKDSSRRETASQRTSILLVVE